MFPMMHSRLLLLCCVIYSVIWLSSASHHHCGKYERPVKCIDQCQTCEYKNGGCAQPAVCIKGCDCIPGFFRNKQNKCIPADSCPVCGPNSKPSDCVFCEPTCRNPKPEVCAQSCTSGCACDDGFLKDDNGNCIPENQCPIVCGPNSKPSDCVFCEPTCRNPKPQVCAQSCTSGCACDDGFLKDDNGNCIPGNECPIVCGPNSKPSDCVSLCEPTCRNRKPGFCPQACTKGCACDDGFLKDDNGNCIPENQCSSPGPTQQCGQYEVPVKCIDQCQTCQYRNGNCSQGTVCIPGCDCLPGFFRNQQKQCIPAAFCPGTGPGPSQQCPPNEFPVECVDRCQRCEYKNGNCGQGQACTPGCNCVPGFLRDKTNKCIPADFCPDQCKSDEQYYSDIPDCKNTCENYNNPGAICPQYFAPRPGCFCAIGLVKRKDGKCVKPENCIPPGNPCLQEKDPGPCYGYFPRFYYNKKTGQCENFIYGGCFGNSNNFESKQFCEAICKGTGPGPAQQCPAGEIPVECIDRCQRCEYKNGNCSQILICTPGCNCLPGFLRDSTNKCIPADFCPGTGPGPAQQCPAGEIPVDCIDRCQRCEYKNGNCAQAQVCTPGCNCVPGFLRDSTNKCIPANFCPGTGPGPAQQCPAGEIPVECIDRCQRCEYKNGNCSQILICTPGCNCVPGFLRDSTNKCIPADFCPGTGPGPAQQCPAGEIPVDCIDRCQRCEYKNGNCAQAQVCTPGCNCAPGFLRDSTNKCIPANFCPGTGPGPAQQCPAGEFPVGCIDRCQRCEYKNGNCSQIQVCTPGCNCVPGFLRDSTNKCIPADFCPAPTPAQQCGVYERPVECIDQCQTCQYRNGNCSQGTVCIPGCDCVPGFFRNQQKQCIPAAFCPGTGPGPAQQCPAGEIPVECVDRCQRCEYKNGNCGQGQACTPGCNCLRGFLRDKTNKCIPANLCPDQCKSDEQYYSDIPDCKNTCENYNNPGAICPQYFAPRPGCFCAIGLVKRNDGQCVKPENCFPPGNPCLQEKDPGPCYGSFPRFYYNKKTGQCENFIYGGCFGNSNNFESKEVCEVLCKGPGPAQQCGQYERPVECIDQCQTCEYRNGGCAQPAVCIPGCDCIPGFFRNKQKQCIPAAFCPGTGPGPAQQCPPYEYPVPCIDKCQTCEYKNGHCIQTGECTRGCNCVPGFLRDKTKKCIPASQCP